MDRSAIVFPGAAPISSDTQLITLLRRCASREQQALRELWQATAPQLLAWLVQMLGEPDEADLLLPECYRMVWRDAVGYRADLCPPRIWLRGLARSLAVDALRDRTIPADPEVLQAMLMQVDGTEPATAMLRLLRLAYASGCSCAEAAEATAMNVTDARRQIREGLARMLREPETDQAPHYREEILAGAWVLGVQSAAVRRRYQRRLLQDPVARRRRMAWEARLAVLAEDPPPVRPDQKLWNQVATGIGSRVSARRASAQRWPWFALLLAIGAAAVFMLMPG